MAKVKMTFSIRRSHIEGVKAKVKEILTVRANVIKERVLSAFLQEAEKHFGEKFDTGGFGKWKPLEKSTVRFRETRRPSWTYYARHRPWSSDYRGPTPIYRWTNRLMYSLTASGRSVGSFSSGLSSSGGIREMNVEEGYAIFGSTSDKIKGLDRRGGERVVSSSDLDMIMQRVLGRWNEFLAVSKS